MAEQPTPGPTPNHPQQTYFTTLAPTYPHHTGNTTRLILDSLLTKTPLRINNYSSIHDTACGDGTATASILDFCAARAIPPPTIRATDCNDAMIEALKARKVREGGKWATVSAKVLDSRSRTLPDDGFHFIFCNFSVATMSDPRAGLYNIHRTLRPGGIAVVTAWKRFGVGAVMTRAQRLVKGEGFEGAMKQVGVQFDEEGVLARWMEEAGWEVGKIKTVEERVVVREGSGEMAGLREFLMGELSAPARKGWSEEEVGRWEGAVDEAIKGEVGEFGGILMDAWVVLARKWDAMYG